MSINWSHADTPTIPVYVFDTGESCQNLINSQPTWQAWLKSTQFHYKPGSVVSLPNSQGDLSAVIAIHDPANPAAFYRTLSGKLAPGNYRLEQSGPLSEESTHRQALLQLAEGGYRFQLEGDDEPDQPVQWFLPSGFNGSQEQSLAEACALVRDLINAPPNHMQPPDLFLATKQLCDRFSACLSTIQGRDLLAAGYEATYRVGQVGSEPPCLLDFTWGEESHPRVTLVGKGVCFDSGGLCLKTAKGMLTMKKDMGGAAHVLGLAHLIMSNKLPIRLRVLIPAVENGIGQGAYRPGDVLRYSDGTSVEISNTDAEGRLIVADGILAACANETPDCLIDFTTLTGAARIAVGMDIAAFFTTNQSAVPDFLSLAEKQWDSVWPLPLHGPYRSALSSHVADLKNAALNPYGGAITAALFLQHFVPDNIEWWHFDVSAWSEGAHTGAAVMGMRAMFQWLLKKYS